MIFLLILFSACFQSGDNHIVQDDDDPALTFVNNYSKEIKEKYSAVRRLYGFDYAGPDKVYDGKIHVVDLMYSIDKKIKFDEARKLFYLLADQLIRDINKDESLKKYFFHFPVGYNDLHFTLAFDYENKLALEKDDVDMIAIYENEIFYEIVEKDGGKDEIKNEQVVPDVYIMRDIAPKTHCIRRSLPEKISPHF